MTTTSTGNLQAFSYKAGSWDSPFPNLDSPTTLVLAFGVSSMMDQSGPLEQLAAAFPQSSIVGCSTSGEIHARCLEENSLSCVAIRFRKTRLATAYAPVRTAADSARAGELIAEQLAAPDLKAVFVLSDGLQVNGSDLVAGINGRLGSDVIVTGGLAGDGTNFKRTWVLRSGQAKSGVVSAVGFYGDAVRIGHCSRGGWDPFGPERKVTRSDGNVLFELDGKPALSLYKQYLGDRAAGLPATALLFPLSIRKDSVSEKVLVRTILAVNEQDQSMTFAGDVPQGSLAQLMRANFDRVVAAAGASATEAAQRSGEGPQLQIAISCVGRRLILGERTEDELEAAAECLVPGDVQVGFYSYGELSPFSVGHCDLHNQTMTITSIREVQ